MKTPFLTARWEKLILANYPVNPDLLLPHVPAGTELDEWKGKYYVSLVGFRFNETKLKGIAIPFHTDFPEVNLRFYVRRKTEEGWRRGVVFIKEIVPLPAISWVANWVYGERYATLPVKRRELQQESSLLCGYDWKYRGQWNTLEAVSNGQTQPIIEGSDAEFITQHFWGYARRSGQPTVEYQVDHPLWKQYPVNEYRIQCDFGQLYGESFSFLRRCEPDSVHFAEGSAVSVFPKRLV